MIDADTLYTLLVESRPAYESALISEHRKMVREALERIVPWRNLPSEHAVWPGVYPCPRRRAKDPVVWADEASPFTGAQVKDLLDENERLRRESDRHTGEEDKVTRDVEHDAIVGMSRRISDLEGERDALFALLRDLADDCAAPEVHFRCIVCGSNHTAEIDGDSTCNVSRALRITCDGSDSSRSDKEGGGSR